MESESHGILNPPLVVINLGLTGFPESLQGQGVEAVPSRLASSGRGRSPDARVAG